MFMDSVARSGWVGDIWRQLLKYMTSRTNRSAFRFNQRELLTLLSLLCPSQHYDTRMATLTGGIGTTVIRLEGRPVLISIPTVTVYISLRTKIFNVSCNLFPDIFIYLSIIFFLIWLSGRPHWRPHLAEFITSLKSTTKLRE